MSIHPGVTSAPAPRYWSFQLAGAVLVLGCLLTFSSARAVEVLTVHELVLHCQVMEEQPERADSQYCIRYIQGFIDGAVVTDVRVMLNVEADAGQAESFSERAKRTRAPTRTDRFRAARLAGFCLGDPLPLKEVVEKVVTYLVALDVDDTAQSPARDAVYDSLLVHYPCDNE